MVSTTRERRFRAMLALGGVVYLTWWFAVEWLLPGAFNPLLSRLLVVAFFLAAFALSFVSVRIERRAESLYYTGALLLIGHYFYLFHHNARDTNWTVGTYVVVFALCVGVESRAWLFACAGHSLACGFTVWLLDASLRTTVFLPGLATILVLCVAVQLSRIRLLEGLSESAGRFQSLFDATFEGVTVHDAGKIIDVNASFAALFGYSREELLGMSVAELNAPEYRERVSTQIRDVPSNRYESVGLRKDGTRFAIEISSKPHLYRGRALRLATVRDVSDRQQVEQERSQLIQEQAARASAQEAIRLRDEFLSIASHELRTPITSLLLHLDLFERRWRAGREPKFVETYLTRVRRQLKRMNRLVEELLDVSRLGASRLKLTREVTDLDDIVREVMDSLSEDLQRADCQVELRSSGPLEGLWDRLRLEQVVENLLRNALTYGAGKPIELALSRAAGGRAVLAVRDHGIGIEKSLHEKVFLRFERAVSAMNYGGLGLGLYITRQIVEAHQGVVRVESEPGIGSTFWVELPMHDTPSRNAAGSGPLQLE